MTTDSQRIAARSATTHGLFARDVVLPRLGEDPQAYEAFLQELNNQLQPKNLLEQHYAEKIAAASWRLRRLHRWQAQLFEDADLSEDAALAKLTSVLRYETTLHRQIDTSVKMLGRELPKLFEERVRADLIRRMNGTEKECQEDPYMNEWITQETRKRTTFPPVPASLDLSRLDTADAQQENCENEPAVCTGMAPECTGMARHAPTEDAPASAPAHLEGGEAAVGARSPRPIESKEVLTPMRPRAFCQNEPAVAHPLPQGEVRGLAHSEGSPNPLPREGEGRRLAAGERGPF